MKKFLLFSLIIFAISSLHVQLKAQEDFSPDIIFIKGGPLFTSLREEEYQIAYQGLGYSSYIGYDINFSSIHFVPYFGYIEIIAKRENEYQFERKYITFSPAIVFQDPVINSWIGFGPSIYIPSETEEKGKGDLYFFLSFGIQKEIGITGVYITPEIKFSYNLSQNLNKEIYTIDILFGIGVALSSY